MRTDVPGSGLKWRDSGGDHPLVGRRMPDLTLQDGTDAVLTSPRRRRYALLEGRDLPAARILVRPGGYVRWATDDAEAEVPGFGLRCRGSG
ncbi:hypothetical protein [Kribbella sp. NPDC000426]|uniref:hypothetical protein n=1 Tax=Kribbella sp. NPDC000426 TaxID=3154255 RepID=UPI00332A349A